MWWMLSYVFEYLKFVDTVMGIQSFDGIVLFCEQLLHEVPIRHCQ